MDIMRKTQSAGRERRARAREAESPPRWSAGALAWAGEKGLVAPEERERYETACTRAQLAQLLSRLPDQKL